MTWQLTIRGPLHAGVGRTAVNGIDKANARNAATACAIIPESEFQGRLSHLALELGIAPDRIADLFGLGRAWGEKDDRNRGRRGSGESRAGRLLFEDLESSVTASHVFLHHARDEDDQVSAGALYTVESPLRDGECATFTGAIRFLSGNQPTADRVAAEVSGLVRALDQIGAFWHTNWGEIVGASVETAHKRFRLSSAKTAQPRYSVSLSPSAPFCLPGILPSLGNLYASETRIRGGVIKGTIAAMIKRALDDGPAYTDDEREALDRLSANLSTIRFTDALPGSHPQPRAFIPPLSLAVGKSGNDEQLFDSSRLAKPPENMIDLRYDLDWKRPTRDRVRVYLASYGVAVLAEAKTMRRSHTAINEQRTAEESQLYTHELVEPTGVAWVGTIDLSQLPAEDIAPVGSALCGVLTLGLHGVGKTKVFVGAAVTIDHSVPGTVSPLERDGVHEWVLVLQSEALLLLPDDVRGPSSLRPYVGVFDELSRTSSSSPCLALASAIASERLAGGVHLSSAFRWPAWEPQVLTEAGSTFVLRCDDPARLSEAQKLIDEWSSRGLPIRRSILSYFGIDTKPAGDWWQRIPFVRENGYGEVTVNHQIHQQLLTPTPLQTSRQK